MIALRFAIAVLLYPGALFLVAAAIATEWGLGRLRQATAGELVEWRDAPGPAEGEGVAGPVTLAAAVGLACAAPALAMALLPWPGNPATSGASLWTIFCLLQVPPLALAGLALASPAPFTQLAGLRQVQLTAIAGLPAVVALAAAAAARGSGQSAGAPTSPAGWVALLLAGGAYALALPAAAARNPFAGGWSLGDATRTLLTALPGPLRHPLLLALRAWLVAQLGLLVVAFSPWMGRSVASAMVGFACLALGLMALGYVELHTAALRISHARDFLWTVALAMALLALVLVSFV